MSIQAAVEETVHLAYGTERVYSARLMPEQARLVDTSRPTERVGRNKNQKATLAKLTRPVRQRPP